MLEGSVEVFFSVHSVHVHRCRDELVVVYRPVAIGISLNFVNQFKKKKKKKEITS